MFKIPRAILVPLVICIGIVILVLSQEPHTACDSQKEVFVETQAGYLFRARSGKDRSPQYIRFLNTCRDGASPGACYELFALVKKTLRDLQAAPMNCIDQFRDIPELQKVLEDTIEVFVVMAWGSQPPEPGASRYSWLEVSDLALFCQIRRNYLQFYGQENYEELRKRTQAILPGEPLLIGPEGRCQNCVDDDSKNESRRRMAPDVLTPEETWSRSLFSIRCEQYF